jgi:hypothetical protein
MKVQIDNNMEQRRKTTNKIQQIPFIDLFKSALHISGDKFAHFQ